MKKLIKIICFFLAVIFASYLCNAPAIASEVLTTRFGNTTLKFPYPDKLCLLGRKGGEKLLWDHQAMTHTQAGNKLLGVWIDCGEKTKLQNDEDGDIKEWVLAVGRLTGTPKIERVFPQLRRDQYLKALSKAAEGLSFDGVKEKVDRALERANSVYFGDKTAVIIDDLINLGILEVGGAIYQGWVMNSGNNIEKEPIAIVAGATLIKGAPIGIYFYKMYQGKESVDDLLSKSKHYNAKLIFSN